MPLAQVQDKKSIIDRRAVAEQLRAAEGADTVATRKAGAAVLEAAHEAGRAEIARRLADKPTNGTVITACYAFLYDQILRLLYDFTVQRLYPPNNPSSAERLALIALGGFGRSEMAPYSDLDIGFLTPYKQSAWGEQVIESILYTLWDLGLKVGHSVRSIDDTVRLAGQDMTIRTAMLEARFIWGNEALFDETMARFRAEIVEGSAKEFTAAKLEERDARHERMGDSRYVVEPNVKDGMGGLRDLHALFWIGRYVHQVRDLGELVEKGLLTKEELQDFRKARRFLLAVRCHLHLVTDRPEERLTFDYQTEIARRMDYADRTGQPAVERFMQHYFLTAKQVGDLTGVFLAHLDEQYGKQGRRFLMPRLRRKPRKLNGFTLDRGRLAIPEEDFFERDPVRLIEMFALADKHGLEIHPLAIRQAARDEHLAATIREDNRANALFLDILTSPRDPETVLRWMNEAGVFGRFVPDFGKVVAQMQFDMYHHYTVDEHTIRAIGLLAKIERGDLEEDHPLGTRIMTGLVSRRALYVAVLLHDIAKGRGGDHSVIGAEIAEELCPRLGLDPGETQTVSWLVRWHLLMSATAFKRDLADPKTIEDFVLAVKSPERLKMLSVLTVVDIRAVGPGVWNAWKGQLLTDLYQLAEESLRLGHKQQGRTQKILEAKEALARRLSDWDKDDRIAHFKRLPDAYWIAESEEVAEHNARQAADAEGAAEPLSIVTRPDEEREATWASVYAADHPGLFYRLAGAVHAAGGNIVDARIYTTRDGMALDNVLLQDPLGRPFAEPEQLARLDTAIRDALANRDKLDEKLEARPLPRARAEAFHIEPLVLIDNRASNRYTVIEVNALDRPALLYALARALFESKATIRSAHIATYGERAVDTFYVTDLLGDKITKPPRMKTLKQRLLEAAAMPEDADRAAA